MLSKYMFTTSLLSDHAFRRRRTRASRVDRPNDDAFFKSLGGREAGFEKGHFYSESLLSVLFRSCFEVSLLNGGVSEEGDELTRLVSSKRRLRRSQDCVPPSSELLLLCPPQPAPHSLV